MAPETTGEAEPVPGLYCFPYTRADGIRAGTSGYETLADGRVRFPRPEGFRLENEWTPLLAAGDLVLVRVADCGLSCRCAAEFTYAEPGTI
jgi:hypothetical protein